MPDLIRRLRKEPCALEEGSRPAERRAVEAFRGRETLPELSYWKRAIADLKRNGLERDFLIVDTPGSFMTIIKDAVTAADCVIIPMQPSPIDILAQEDVLLLVISSARKATRWRCSAASMAARGLMTL